MGFGEYFEISQGPISGIGSYERPGALEQYMQPYDGLGVADAAQPAPIDPTLAAQIACTAAGLTWDINSKQCTQVHAPQGGSVPSNVGQLINDCTRAGNIWDPISQTCKYFAGPVIDPSIITQCNASGTADWDAATKTCKPRPTIAGMQLTTVGLIAAGAAVLYFAVLRKKR